MSYFKKGDLKGKHAIFSPSQPSWLNYDSEKALLVFENKKMAERGTKLHAWAKETIDLKINQQRSKATLYSYVNDAIGYNMQTEVLLYYSDLFFGTADAISFDGKKLRIHDLKTGKGKVHIEQLMIYAALYCLEKRIKPFDIKFELRIYQNDEILRHKPSGEEIKEIMDKIIYLNTLFSERGE